MSDILPLQYSKEDLLKIKGQDFSTQLTVGKLKKFIEENNIPDDALVLIQRVEDFYFEKNNWKVYLKEGQHTHYFKQFNESIQNNEFENKNLKEFSEQDIELSKEQYHPAFCCVNYLDEPDKDFLFIDLHY